MPEATALPTDKRGFTVNEFLANYGIGRTRFYEELNAGNLKARRSGRRVVIAREDADAWLASLPLHTPEARAS